MPKLRRPELGMKDHLSAKLPAGTLERIDRAGNGDRSQGARAVVAAGLDALEGLPVRAPAPDPSREVSPGAALDVDALADALIDRLPAPTVRRVEPPDSGAIAAGIVLAMRDPATRGAIVAELPASPLADVSALAGALYDLVGPMLADAVADGARRARRPELAPVGVVGVARVVDALRAAFEGAAYGGPMGDADARRVLSRAVIDAVNVFAYGEAGPPVPDAPKKLEPGIEAPPAPSGRRRPPATPRPGGQRRAPVPDPPERRAADRLTDADVGRWVAETDNGRFKAHKLTRIGGGGAAECACGYSIDLRLARVADEGRRRCTKCEAAG